MRTPEYILEEALPADIRALYDENEQRAVPRIAKDKELVHATEERAKRPLIY